MTNDQNKNEDHNNKKGISAAKAGAVGLLLGAAGTAALVLSDREMRKRATKKAGEMSHTIGIWSNKTIKNLQGTTEKTKENLKENITELKEKQKEIDSNAKDKLARSIH